MAISPDKQPGAIKPLSSSHSANTIPAASLALLLLFGSLVIGGMLPLRVLDPAWQLRQAASLLSLGPIALVALALQHLAMDLGAPESRLRLRHKRFMALALVASLGFLLLIPLHGSASIRQLSRVQEAQQQRIAIAAARLAALRQVVATSTDNTQMNTRLRELNGPVLGPSDLVQPLPLLRAQVSAALDQADLQILRERQANPLRPKIALLPDLLRNAIADLALAFGFAALGRRPGAYQSPIRELQSAWERSNRRRAARRSSPLDPLLGLIDRIRVRWWR